MRALLCSVAVSALFVNACSSSDSSSGSPSSSSAVVSSSSGMGGATSVSSPSAGPSGTSSGGNGGSGGAAACYDMKPGCLAATSAVRDTMPNVSTDDQSAFIASNTAFAIDLGHELEVGGDNTVFSPYSISTAIAMAYGGAESPTDAVIAATMHFDLPAATLHPAFDWLALQLASRAQSPQDPMNGGFHFKVADAVWSDATMKIEQPFVDLLATDYGASVRYVDFTDLNGSAALINGWVGDQTNQKITNIVAPLDLEDTLMALVNAVYFSAAWATPFDKASTAKAPFHVDGGADVSADTMHGYLDTAGYGEGEGYQALEIPYDGTPMSMFVVMPDLGTADDFGAALTADALTTIRASMQTSAANLSFPKFSFDFHTSLFMALEDLGMTPAFEDGANFTGISKAAELKMKDVIHEAQISVDENGTEASAATVVILSDSSSGTGPQPVTVNIDHPFFFFIRDNVTGAIIFSGRVNDPTKS